MKKIIVLIIGIIVSHFLFTGCGSDTESPVLQSINIKSSNGNLLDVSVEEQTTLSVTGFDQFNAIYAINSTIEWSADNANVSIDQDGLLTAQAVGTAVVTAVVEQVEATFDVRVWDSTAPRTEIYVSDVGTERNGPHQIVKYDESGMNGTRFINTGLSRPQDIVFLEDQGIVLVSNLQSNVINKFDIETGDLQGSWATGLASPTRMDIGPDGLLYVIPWDGGSVKRYDLDGTFIDDFTDTSVDEAIGMAWDTDGNLYVSSFNNGANGFVRKFDTSGNDLGLFIENDLDGPTDIWFDDDGNMYVNDWSANSVKLFGHDGFYRRVFISNISQPEGVAILDDGHILIGASGSSSVRMYDQDGAYIQDLVESGGGGLITPNAVIIRKVNH